MSKGGNELAFGDFGIRALAPVYLTNRQIEAARIAMTRYIKRGGRVWIDIFPDRPLTKHPAEARMGSGKGARFWIANVGRPRAVRDRRRLEAVARRGTSPRCRQAPYEVQDHCT